jgi:hypothetical protein
MARRRGLSSTAAPTSAAAIPGAPGVGLATALDAPPERTFLRVLSKRTQQNTAVLGRRACGRLHYTPGEDAQLRRLRVGNRSRVR